ncbi:MAG: DUF1573 domain-containing protein [Bacteroidales bacterium]
MKKMFLAFAFVVSTLSLFAQGAPSIVFANMSHDFGTISDADGSVSCEFVFTNNGDAPLVISRVTASCGCTTPSWTQEPIAPGKTGFIKATYAAKGRPGAFSKTITVVSNAKEGTVMLNIKGTVQPANASIEEQYPFSIGELRLKSFLLSMYDVSTKGLKSDRIEMYNNGKSPLLVRFGNLPSHLTVVANPSTLQPGAKGEISVTYKATVLKDWGSRTDDVFVLLNNETRIASDRKLVVSANLVEDFSTITPAQREAAGHLDSSTMQLDLGVVKSGEKREKTVTLRNLGKTTLQIRKVSVNQLLLKAKVDRMSIAPGKTATLTVTLMPAKLRGGLNEQVNIISNDPARPNLVIRVVSSI